jgi:methylthioribose-1-phosphate isomerase
MAHSEPMRWEGDRIVILDQRRLPQERVERALCNVGDVVDAIVTMAVRGAPLIGIVAAYGLVLAARHGRASVLEAAHMLRTARPTAVNLMRAVDRMRAIVATASDHAIVQALEQEAHAIAQEEARANYAIGIWALQLIRPEDGVLTHCNAGALATAPYGTATAPMYIAHEQGRAVKVYATETRPVLQGARLTAYELAQAGIDVTLITDSMVGTLMAQGKVHAVVVGADRIAANGDTANKIGTYTIAVLAKAHNIPLYVTAPTSSIDARTPTGAHIPIEERDASEVTTIQGTLVAPVGVHVYNPAFDITPHHLITAIVTEQGIIRAPYEDKIARL